MDRCSCTCGKYACASVRGRRHGTVSCYRAGCRCEDCRTGEARRVRDRDAQRSTQTQAGATKRGQQWTGPEMELAMREDLTIVEIAARLGRSYKAVVARRALCRTDPKWAAIP